MSAGFDVAGFWRGEVDAELGVTDRKIIRAAGAGWDLDALRTSGGWSKLLGMAVAAVKAADSLT
jgi:hypothetical protein